MTKFFPFLLIGFGFGISFYYMFYFNNSMTELERMKHDLTVRKEWFRMLADQKTKDLKWPANWS
jgi:hypothetical protein